MVFLAEVSLHEDAGRNDVPEDEVPTIEPVFDESAVLAAELSRIGRRKIKTPIAPEALSDFAIVLERARVKS